MVVVAPVESGDKIFNNGKRGGGRGAVGGLDTEGKMKQNQSVVPHDMSSKKSRMKQDKKRHKTNSRPS